MYSGKAAMQLMGDWDVSSMLGLNKEFVTSGNLGLAPFPSVEGGSGDPADLAGNTASYVAISSKASAARSGGRGLLPGRAGLAGLRQGQRGRGRGTGHQGRHRPVRRAQLATYDQTIYSSVQSAPSFQYSWDQAVPPQEATPMLANLAQVFELTMTPQKFAATMDSQNTGA